MSRWFPDLTLPVIEDHDPRADDGQRELHEHPPRIVTRDDWDAEDVESEDEARLEDIEDFPVPYVVTMHTRTRNCTDKEDCKLAVKEIQRSHLDAGEPDILYNFLIDPEGFIYIGRGPAVHSMTFPEDDKKMRKTNRKCIVIGYIGNGGVEPPELLIQGSASLLALMYDGKYIDEEVDFVWYHPPVKGLPPEDEHDRKREDLEEMLAQIEMDKIEERFLEEARERAVDENI